MVGSSCVLLLHINNDGMRRVAMAAAIFPRPRLSEVRSSLQAACLAARDRALKRIAPLVLALLLDALCGEPPGRVHPVVWTGRLLDWLEARAPQHEVARLLYGAFVALAVPLGWAWLAHVVE